MLSCSPASVQSQPEPIDKYVFLDFDGAVHPSTTLQGKNVALLANSPAALRDAGFFVWADDLELMLAEVEAEADAGDGERIRIHVIVHSSWRAQPWFSAPVIREALGALGQRVCGYTRPELPRGEAVEELCDRMEIEDYLVLDDDTAAFVAHPRVQGHLLALNPLRGVREPHVRACLARWATARTAPSPCGSPSPAAA
jgi:hypothetical protein